MKNYSILLLTILILTFSLFPAFTIVKAGPLDTAKSHLDTLAGDIGFDTSEAGGGSVAVIVGRIIKAILSILGIVFMILTIYGGWLWMTAAGNEQRVDQAKNLLRSSIFGLIVIIGAYAITTFVLSSLLGSISPTA